MPRVLAATISLPAMTPSISSQNLRIVAHCVHCFGEPAHRKVVLQAADAVVVQVKTSVLCSEFSPTAPPGGGCSRSGDGYGGRADAWAALMFAMVPASYRPPRRCPTCPIAGTGATPRPGVRTCRVVGGPPSSHRLRPRPGVRIVAFHRSHRGRRVEPGRTPPPRDMVASWTRVTKRTRSTGRRLASACSRLVVAEQG